MRKVLSVFGALALTGCMTAGTGDALMTLEREGVAATQPATPRSPEELQVLFWNEAQRSARFRDMEDWFAGLDVEAAPTPRTLPRGTAFSAPLKTRLDTLVAETGAAGLMVLQDGRIRYENYGLGFGPEGRWTSFSVAKSFTSTLLGAALEDGFITSLDEKVTRYIPGLRGSAYDDVTIRQLATMSSGVAWNEDYTDPASDVARMTEFQERYGKEAIVAQMRSLPREAPAGSKWVYKTGETNLLGLLVEEAVGMPLAAYAKDKIVDPAGFAGDLFWMTDPRGGNIGGCCLSIRLSDYARFGQFVLEGGKGVVSPDWFAEATAPRYDVGAPGFGYGYQWWTYPGGNFGAQGIFGQSITILPQQRMVIALVGNWPTATSRDHRNRMLEAAALLAAES
ncbi:serine hydrolase domain-containing protein [Qipengyuania spongiae]|uniref:Beta-lactamase family protein n=1 Tax=Qipengyuania spongiae TaxID=2909673 RepID=A0ABY5T101_9SPHN|nr:serine hydrolase [Qipengyuania spongiae]UVI39018.1 beta-lactamase family protein [Qipengyuania spongiae]